MSGTDPEGDSDYSRQQGVGDDPREGMDTANPPGKTWFRDLDEAVIEADRCVQCASCVAACPSDSIGIDYEEGRPTLVRMCTGCSRCWDFCPRSGLRSERVLELVGRERALSEPVVHAARANTQAASMGQDGGVVTMLLAEAIEAGLLDGAVVAAESEMEPLKGEATLATTRKELLASAGSSYNQTMALGQLDALLDDADLDAEGADIALVGTPCMIQGATALDRYDNPAVEAISLTVALMCTRSFEHERLLSRLADFDVDSEMVEELDVSGGTMYAYTQDGETLLSTDVDDFDGAGLRGCDECADFVGGTADISAGSVGTDDGYTTVVVRTEAGARAWEQAAARLNHTEIDRPTAMEKLAVWNSRRAKSIMPREVDPDGTVGITYEEHRRAFDGTDREPESLNPARAHQYEEWC